MVLTGCLWLLRVCGGCAALLRSMLVRWLCVFLSSVRIRKGACDALALSWAALTCVRTHHSAVLCCTGAAWCCCCVPLQCMHSQAVDFTCTKLVLEPGNKLMFAASLATADASECVSVHSLGVEVRRNNTHCSSNSSSSTTASNSSSSPIACSALHSLQHVCCHTRLVPDSVGPCGCQQPHLPPVTYSSAHAHITPGW